MRHRITKFALMVTLAAPLHAADPEPSQAPVVMRPEGGWILNYKDNSCALQRTFVSDSGKKVMLDLDKFAPGMSLQVSVQSGDFPRASGKPRITYLPRGYTQENDDYYIAKFPEGRRGLIVNTSPYSLADEVANTPRDLSAVHLISREETDRRNAEITSLHIGNVFEQDLDLRLGTMGPPMTVLDQCVGDLVKFLGIEVSAEDLAEPAKPIDQATWAERLVNEYPSPIVRDNQEAILQVRLVVDKEGKVANCYVRSRDDVFSDTACDILLKYARFYPARDKSGQPARSIWTTRITYRSESKVF